MLLVPPKEEFRAWYAWNVQAHKLREVAEGSKSPILVRGLEEVSLQVNLIAAKILGHIT